jgi:hypothetical protein
MVSSLHLLHHSDVHFYLALGFSAGPFGYNKFLLSLIPTLSIILMMHLSMTFITFVLLTVKLPAYASLIQFVSPYLL